MIYLHFKDNETVTQWRAEMLPRWQHTSEIPAECWKGVGKIYRNKWHFSYWDYSMNLLPNCCPSSGPQSTGGHEAECGDSTGAEPDRPCLCSDGSPLGPKQWLWWGVLEVPYPTPNLQRRRVLLVVLQQLFAPFTEQVRAEKRKSSPQKSKCFPLHCMASSGWCIRILHIKSLLKGMHHWNPFKRNFRQCFR